MSLIRILANPRNLRLFQFFKHPGILYNRSARLLPLFKNPIIQCNQYSCKKSPKKKKSSSCIKPKCKKKSGLEKKPCRDNCKKSKSKKKKKKSKKPKFVSMWEPADCDMSKCPDPEVPVRFDEICPPKFGKKKKYQQTWVSCPKPRKMKIKVCPTCYEDLDPPLPRRCIEESKPDTACPIKTQPDCKPKGKDDKNACMKVRIPICCKARNPPSCTVYRGPKDCRKVKCPFPSYSECSKPKIRPARPSECNCLRVRSMCEVLKIAKRKGYLKN